MVYHILVWMFEWGSDMQPHPNNDSLSTNYPAVWESTLTIACHPLAPWPEALPPLSLPFPAQWKQYCTSRQFALPRQLHLFCLVRVCFRMVACQPGGSGDCYCCCCPVDQMVCGIALFIPRPAHVSYVIAAECAVHSPRMHWEGPKSKLAIKRAPIDRNFIHKITHEACACSYERGLLRGRGARGDTEIALVIVEQGHSHWVPQGCTGCAVSPGSTLA